MCKSRAGFVRDHETDQIDLLAMRVIIFLDTKKRTDWLECHFFLKEILEYCVSFKEIHWQTNSQAKSLLTVIASISGLVFSWFLPLRWKVFLWSEKWQMINKWCECQFSEWVILLTYRETKLWPSFRRRKNWSKVKRVLLIYSQSWLGLACEWICNAKRHACRFPTEKWVTGWKQKSEIGIHFLCK